MKKIRALILKHTLDSIVMSIDIIKDDLNTFYDIINCDTIDIQVRFIGGVPYNFIFDDEYLLKDKPKATLIEKNKNEVICGNVIICPLNLEDSSELGSFESSSDALQVAELITALKGLYTFE